MARRHSAGGLFRGARQASSFAALGGSPNIIAAPERVLLPNGLRAVHVATRRQNKFQLHILSGIGSIHDPEGLKGLAHVAEHVSIHLIDRDVRGMAKRVGRTYFDYTHLWFEADPPFFPKLLRKVGEHLAAADTGLITEQLISLHQGLIRREIAQWDSPRHAARLYRLLYQTAFKRHLYRWPPLGMPAHLHHISASDVRSLYKRRRNASNTVLVYLGPASNDHVFGDISKMLGSLPAGRAGARRRLTEPPQDRQRRRFLNNEGRLSQGVIGFKLPQEDDIPFLMPAVARLLLLCSPLGKYHGLRQDSLRLFWTFALTEEPALFEIYWQSLGRPLVREKSVLDACRLLVDPKFVRTALSRTFSRGELHPGGPGRLGHDLGAYELLFGDFLLPFRHRQLMRTLEVGAITGWAARAFSEATSTIVLSHAGA